MTSKHGDSTTDIISSDELATCGTRFTYTYGDPGSDTNSRTELYLRGQGQPRTPEGASIYHELLRHSFYNEVLGASIYHELLRHSFYHEVLRPHFIMNFWGPQSPKARASLRFGGGKLRPIFKLTFFPPKTEANPSLRRMRASKVHEKWGLETSL